MSDKPKSDFNSICELSQVMLDTIPFGMDIVDEEGNILFMNSNFQRLFGKEAVGKKCWDMYRDDRKRCDNCPLKTGIKVGETLIIDAEGCLGGKILRIHHTGMMYQGKKSVLEIFEDITVYKKAEEEIKMLSERKSAFVSHVSHEFKNPLFTAQESLKIVPDKEIGAINTEQERMLTFTKNSIDRLLRLVTDLLDLAKIEAGRVELKKEKIDIIKFISEIAETHKIDLSKKEIVFKKDILRDIGAFFVDKDKMTEVFSNILENAIKYTPKKGHVTIKAESGEKEIRFEISDTGPGIPKEGHERIFDKFERITKESQEGTGLGLPIARDIVKLHGGRIRVESEIGRGSKFIFILPADLQG